MKVKKFILPIVLSLVIALSGFTLFGCGKKEDKQETYKLVSGVIDTLKADDTLFETKTTHGLSTEFSIKDIGYKSSQNSSLTGYQYYISVLGGGLNFINDYYGLLNTEQGVVRNPALNEATKTMKNSYDNMKIEHGKLLDAKNVSNLNYEIYNGYFYNYRISVSNFISKVYDCAFSLANYLDRYLNISANVGKESMTQESFEFYIDYEYLKVYDDFKVLYMNSACGADLNVSLVENQIKNVFTKFNELTAKEKAPAGGLKNAESLVTMFKQLAQSRVDAQQAMNGFSIYRFVEVYGQDLAAYKKDSENAETYYNKIINYFTSDSSTINLLINKLENDVVNSI